MMFKNQQKNKGYTLLFAVLVSSIVLSIGISILAISKKEFALSSSAKDSTIAFYAADSGLECAQYNNDFENVFATSTLAPNTSGNSASFNCNGTSISPEFNAASANDPFVFDFHFPINANACTVVSVEKSYEEVPGLGNVLVTRILSKGYNIGWTGSACEEQSSRRVERALQLTY